MADDDLKLRDKFAIEILTALVSNSEAAGRYIEDNHCCSISSNDYNNASFRIVEGILSLEDYSQLINKYHKLKLVI